MSPGGLLSAGTGAWPPPPAGADAEVVLPVVPGGPARLVPAARGDPEPPHAASAVMSAAAARARPERRQSPRGFLLSDMAWFYRGADEATMNSAAALGLA